MRQPTVSPQAPGDMNTSSPKSCFRHQLSVSHWRIISSIWSQRSAREPIPQSPAQRATNVSTDALQSESGTFPGGHPLRWCDTRICPVLSPLHNIHRELDNPLRPVATPRDRGAIPGQKAQTDLIRDQTGLIRDLPEPAWTVRMAHRTRSVSLSDHCRSPR
jgi:hypothetical protein